MFHHPHCGSVLSFTVKCPEACTFQIKCTRIIFLKLPPKRNVRSECCNLMFKLHLTSKLKNVEIFIQLLNYKVIKFIPKVNWSTFLHFNVSGIATPGPAWFWYPGGLAPDSIHTSTQPLPHSLFLEDEKKNRTKVKNLRNQENDR